MLPAPGRIAAALILVALPCGGTSTSVQDVREPGETKPVEAFPSGTTYDFGKVPAGSVVQHAFRIINTSRVPLRILSVRNSMGGLQARMSKLELRPSETAQLEITVDCRRFRGRKTFGVWVTMESGNQTTEVVFYVTADCREDARP